MDVRYIGVPEYDPDEDVFLSFLEFQHRLYRIILRADLECPPLLDLPIVPNGYHLEPVVVTDKMSEVLRTSTMVASGSDAMIRVSESDQDCVIKFALPCSRSRARVAYEHQMLTAIEQLPSPLPVFRTLGKPLVDQDGLFAFRMERLQEWDSATDLSDMMRDVSKALYKQGICHNDLRPPNLMHNGNRPTLIDFDRAGFVGREVPPVLNSSGRGFSVGEDIAAVKQLGGLAASDEVVWKIYGLVWSLRCVLWS